MYPNKTDTPLRKHLPVFTHFQLMRKERSSQAPETPIRRTRQINDDLWQSNKEAIPAITQLIKKPAADTTCISTNIH
ncbi:hypothetical protein ANN_22728 [Periplaneta americana]|uniref:Uncharacterized protein n=1 Tax=Periplaneta americana TaxID=6978 RepID=A0ABQ8SKA3_PERAM|nr:hypothetical protein ANN_22728 [Periplaneta americana]